VRSDGRVVDLGPPKQRALLAVLLLHAGEIVSSESLIELIWGEDPPRTAAHSVQIYVSGLRTALVPGGDGLPIATRPPGYALEADPGSIDAVRFQRLVADGSDALRSDLEHGAAMLREALELWRGAPLADFAYAEFAREPIRRLEELRLDAIEALAAAELTRGRPKEALAIVEEAVREDPLRERFCELRMLALYRSGRHPDALRAYQRFHRLLADELGLTPSPSLQRLNERVLLHDRSLTPGEIAVPASVRNPYKGLRSFAEEDVDDFFGRDRLVAEVLASLEAGARLVALVGPSGSGKSSVMSAGVIPALRAGALPGSAGWTIATIVPGPRPFEAFERALAGRPDDGWLLIAIDQFEELFTLGDESTAASFLRSLTSGITDAGSRLSVVLALRADFYDRPLLHGDFAVLLSSSVINVLPMAADELEAAVVGPARHVGIDVDPSLLAELVAESTNQVGGLPLMQYALTEIFDRRRGRALSLEEYRGAGGLRALLSRRSEACFAALDEGEQEAALQVFLRLVSLGDGVRPSRRRAPLRELSALDLDPVALSTVLDALARHHLLSFDRDHNTGDAVVEVAHEALFWEWERLAGWIDTHREDLDRHRSLSTAAGEWESSGRHQDYLSTGSRLAGYEAWSRQTRLRLTAIERAFLDEALERRRVERVEEDARQVRQRQLERRAARRLVALAASLLVVAAAATVGVLAWLGSRPPEVVLVYYGGNGELDSATAAGFDRAVGRLDINAEKRVTAPGEFRTELRHEAERGVKLIVAGGGPEQQGALDTVAAQHPQTRFITFDQEGRRHNVTYISYAEEQGSYLAGAAAALESRTGVVGFIGGTDFDQIWRFQAGYEAGARAIDRHIRVRATYLTEPPDFSGFDSITFARRAAERMYSGGVDVIYHAAGNSGYGLFEAATAVPVRDRRQLWAIGVDSDQYRTIAQLAPGGFGVSPRGWRAHILTSMVKRVDRAVELTLTAYERGRLSPGMQRLGLKDGGVELARSGGFIDDIRPELDRLRRRIETGEIKVPTVPVSRRSGP
jgi:basic membrane lipoprotein Med (substrate-binding protein (PBP1-ABC) superfamily)/DNA-binding SARP family transcriptional activator